jgi:hypothetical protein
VTVPPIHSLTTRACDLAAGGEHTAWTLTPGGAGKFQRAPLRRLEAGPGWPVNFSDRDHGVTKRTSQHLLRSSAQQRQNFLRKTKTTTEGQL